MTTSISESTVEPTIRPAVQTDLSAIHRLETQCFVQPWPIEAFEQHLGTEAFFVALSEGNVVGFLVASVEAGFPGPIGHIKDLAVSPSHRRRGLGSRLLERGMVALRDGGATRTSLEVRESNAEAIALYSSHGFHQAQRRLDYYADGETALIMVRELS